MKGMDFDEFAKGMRRLARAGLPAEETAARLQQNASRLGSGIADVYRVPPELLGLPRKSRPVRLWRWVTGFYRD